MARTRSPNFPVVDLGGAVDLATKLEKFAQRHPVPVESAIEKAWGLKVSSYAMQCIGALRQFGLLQEEDSAAGRQVRLTPEAAKIVHGHPDRVTLLAQAAAKPKVHASILAKYPQPLPPDDTIKNFLLFDNEPVFNPSSVAEFIRQFRRTMSFAGVAEPIKAADNPGSDNPNEGKPPNDSKDNTQKDSLPRDAIKRPPVKTGMTQAVFPLDEGEALIQLPASFSAESYEDFEAWIGLVLKKAKRTVTSAVSAQSKSDDDSAS